MTPGRDDPARPVEQPRPALGDPGPGVPLPRFTPVAVILGVIVALGVLGLVLGLVARLT